MEGVFFLVYLQTIYHLLEVGPKLRAVYVRLLTRESECAFTLHEKPESRLVGLTVRGFFQTLIHESQDG
jgi:hypothetical protein